MNNKILGKFYKERSHTFGFLLLLIFTFFIFAAGSALAEKAMTIGPSDQTSRIIMGTNGSKVGVGGDPGSYNFNVNGTLNVTGAITSGASLQSSISSANVSSGTFGGNTGGGNYTFPGTVNAMNGFHAGTTIINWPGYGPGIKQTAGTFLYPGRVDSGDWQGSWYLASSGSYGLYSNTGLYLGSGIYAAGDSWIQGKLGIGSTAPRVKLDVVGGGNSYGTNIYGMWTPDGNSLIRNWSLNDGPNNFGGDYTYVSDSTMGANVMRYPGYNAWRNSQWVPVDITKTYKVSVWCRTVSGTPYNYLSLTQAKYDLSDFGNGGWGHPYFVGWTVFPNTWTQYTMTIGPAGSGAQYNWYSETRYVQLGALMVYGGSGVVDMTGYKIEEVPSTLQANTNALGNLNVAGTVTAGGFSGPMSGTLNAANVSSGNFGANTGGGNYGFGISPSTGDRVEVAGSFRVHTGNNWDATQVYSDGANGYLTGLGDETGMHIRSQFGNVLLADDRGSVGIGTTAPTGKLHVYAGGAGGVGWATGFNVGDSSSFTGLIQDGGVSRWRNFGTGNWDWYSANGGTQIMALSNSGNLTVPGNMYASYFYGSASIRLGDMWGGAGLYRPSGPIVLGTEGAQWIFSSSASTKAIIGTDGNLWMAWAGDWLSNILGSKISAGGSPRFANVYVNGGGTFENDSANNSGYFAMNNSSTWWGIMGNYGVNDWRLGYGGPTSLVGWNLRWDASGNTWTNANANVGGYIDVSGYVYGGELYARDNVYLGYMGNWLSNLVNQSVRSDAGPTFADVYVNGWFRNNTANSGLYNQATANHFYSENNATWTIAGTNGSYGSLRFRNQHQGAVRGAVFWDGGAFGLLNNQENWMLYSPNNNQNVYFPAWGNYITSAATHRNEGTNFIDYSWAMYDSYRGGWRTSNDLYVLHSENSDTVDGYHYYNLPYSAPWNDGWGPYNANSIGASKSGFTYAAGAPYNGPLVHFDASGYNLQLNATYGGDGSNFAYRTRNGDAGSWNNWHNIYSDTYRPYADSAGSTGSLSGYGAGSFLKWNTWENGNYYGSDGNIYMGWYGNWMSNILNQSVRTDSNPTFQHIYTNELSDGNGRIYLAGNLHIDSYNGNEIYLNYYSGAGIRMYGSVWATGAINAGSFVYNSDRSLKQNINTIQDPLEKITQLRGVTFNWKKDNTPGVGLIAQEVEQVFPELVSTNKEGMKGVQYGNLVAPLIEAVKAQQVEIEQLKAQQKDFDLLKLQVQNLEAKMGKTGYRK